MSDSLIPVYGLNPLKNRFLGGDCWDSEPQLVALIRCPDGQTRVVPVTSFSRPKQSEEEFPTKDLDNSLGNLRPITAATINVRVPDKNGGTRSDTVRLMERDDGVYAVYKRSPGEEGYDTLFELADEYTVGELPTHPNTSVGRVFEAHDVGDEQQITEEVDVPVQGGGTTTKEVLVDVEYDRDTTYFAAEVRLFSVDGERGVRGENPNEGLAKEVIEQVRQEFNIDEKYTETRLSLEEGLDDEIRSRHPCPSLEYTVKEKECECRPYRKNKPGYTGDVIKKMDKYVKHRCPDCFGVFVRRNKRELADGMY